MHFQQRRLETRGALKLYVHILGNQTYFRYSTSLYVMKVLRSLLLTAMLVGAKFASAQRTTIILPIDSSSETQIHSVKVVLPEGYADYPSRKYVAVYVFDSQSDPYFDYVAATMNLLSSNGYIQPVLLVGVTSQSRQFDFTPEAKTKAGKAAFNKSGGAELYYHYVKDDVVASIERTYRCEPFRIGIGHSLGGTFLVHCLLSHPELFNANLVISPNLVYDESQMLRRAKETDLSRCLANHYLYLAHGKGDQLEEKFRGATKAFVGIVRSTSAEGFHFVYDSLNNDLHGTTPIEGISKGMLKLYRNLIYSDELFMKQIKGNQGSLLEKVSQFYSANSTWSGLALPMVWDINNLAYNSYYSGKTATSISLLQKGLETHPSDINLYDSMGEIQQQGGNLPLARKYYEQGMAMVERQKAMLSNEKYQEFMATFRNRIAALDKKN